MTETVGGSLMSCTAAHPPRTGAKMAHGEGRLQTRYLFFYFSLCWHHEVVRSFQLCDTNMLNERAPKERSRLCPSAASRDQDYIIDSSYIQVDLSRSPMMLQYFAYE